jgi:predicted DNA binding CopG/RHH family protein
MNAEEIRAIVRQEIVDALKSGKARNHPKDTRPIVTVRLFPEEIAALDAAALARGLSRSKIIRLCLEQVIPEVIRPRQEVPPQFQRGHNRKKARHYRDPATDDRAREEAGRKAVHHALEARRLLREADSAPVNVAAGMLSDAAGRRSVPKLSR